MNSVIRKLDATEIPAFVDIVVNAYPGNMKNTAEFKERYSTMLISHQEKVSSIEFYGNFREDKLVGGMRIHYFKMNVHSRTIDVGGVGLVAVDLLHKKEKVAKELIQYFIKHFVQRDVALVALYPFRPDFYRKMGFGYGTKMNQYHIKPSSFPASGTKEGLINLDVTHKELIEDCYNQYASETHGMILKTANEIEGIFKNPDNKLIGYMNGDKLEGYTVFSFKKMSETNFVHNNMVIKELIYQSSQALLCLSAFFNSQSDQIHRIELTTQDDDIEYVVEDPRNGSDRLIPSVYHETNRAGVGLMYRIINIEKFIENLGTYPFNNETITVGLNIIDSFIKENSRRVVINFREGKATLSPKEKAEVDLSIEISDLSSLLMGAVSFKKLFNFGRVIVNHTDQVKRLDHLFANMQKPLCITAF